MSQAAGIISEKGSLLSHTAIVGRELGLPVVVGVANATQILKTGQIVTLDADTGTIILNEKA
jgi:pyruvate,water dikinase